MVLSTKSITRNQHSLNLMTRIHYGRRFLLDLILCLSTIQISHGFLNHFARHPSLLPSTPPSSQAKSRKLALVTLKAVESSSSSSSEGLLPPAISLENLSCTHNGGETYQLKDVNYVLPSGAKVALIGRNGTGKSTLLNILAEACRPSSVGGREETNYVYQGTISCGKGVKVAHVEQEPPMPSDITVGDAILGIVGGTSITNTPAAQKNNNVYNIVRRYKLAVTNASEDPDEFTAASAAMEERNGWSVLTKADEMATKLRIMHLQDQPLSQLSGGERKRVALCAALVEEPDVLLLDEPTNFLSLAGVQWLTDLLTSQTKLTILMVTHDRAFLQDVSDRILELDRGQLYEHAGNYASFLEAKEERLAIEDAAVQSARSKYRTELEWMRRQPQARESKSKARIQAFYKLEKATKPRSLDPNLVLDSDSQRRIGTKILSMRHVSLKFGDRVMLDDFSYDFGPGDRICLAGANGIGKTTFTKMITGELEPDSGTIELGETVVLGVYDQLGLNFDPLMEQKTVLEFVVEQVQSSDAAISAVTTPDEARKLLRQFEFPRNRWNERVSMLSGGERRRLQLLSVLTVKPNVLILDEPSVDCDMDTLSALEVFLQQFKGVLILVSHDRSFADKVTDKVFVFEGRGVVKEFLGSLSEYASCLVELESNKIQTQMSVEEGSAESKPKTNQKDEKAKRVQMLNQVRNAKKQMINVERALEKLKTKAENLEKEIESSSDEGWTVLADLTDQLNAVKEEIEEKEMTWLELAEELEEAEVEVA